MPRIARVRALSERGLSDAAIAVVMEMYEGMPPLEVHQVRAVRHRFGIDKPMSEARRQQAQGWVRGVDGLFAGDQRGV